MLRNGLSPAEAIASNKDEFCLNVFAPGLYTFPFTKTFIVFGTS